MGEGGVSGVTIILFLGLHMLPLMGHPPCLRDEIIEIRMTRSGAVTFKGSPTVSPTTAALCMSEPLPPSVGSWPPSMYFFALSQAPPVLLMEMANCTPDNKEPGRWRERVGSRVG